MESAHGAFNLKGVGEVLSQGAEEEPVRGLASQEYSFAAWRDGGHRWARTLRQL